ncbi:MAG: BlaI/MecI/CopY family transcriptional regulator [Lachnospiraceae bacterium]
MKKIAKLTDLEIKIMKVLWEHDQSLTIQEIAKYLTSDRISAPSVTQAMKRLVAKKAVVVEDHVLVSSVYARVFCPCFSREEFMSAEIGRLQKDVFGSRTFNAIGIAATLLKNSENKGIKMEQVDELEQIIQNKKKQLLNEDD